MCDVGEREGKMREVEKEGKRMEWREKGMGKGKGREKRREFK